MGNNDKRKNFWNSVGQPIGEGSDSLKEIGLDWEPVAVPIPYEFQGSRMLSSDFRFLINNKTGQGIAPCSDTWQPLGNQEFFNIVRRSLDEVGGTVARGGYSHGAKSSLRLGDRCVYFVSNEIPELGFALYDDDVEEAHSSRLIFYSHHSPGCGMGVKIIVIRKICTNGMIRTGIRSSLHVAHTAKGLEDYRQASNLLLDYKELIQKQRSQLEGLAEVQVTEKEALEHFIAIAGDKKKSAEEQPISVATMQAIYDGSASHVMDDLGINLSVNDYTHGTAYGVLQSVTAYYSHFKGGYSSVDSALKSRVFAESANTIDSAFNSLARAYLPKQREKQGQAVRAW